MDRLAAPARLMIVSDLDQTMADHDDPENLALLRFNALWESNYRHDSLLVFSTGRSPTSYRKLRKEKPLLTPDITIMSVGTEIAYGESMVVDEGWERSLDQKWDRNVVLEETAKCSELTFKSPTKQRPHKVSFYVEKGKAEGVMKSLSEHLAIRGVSNAQEELLQWYKENGKNNPNLIHASERCAGGIIQAIGHFKLGPNTSPRDAGDLSTCKLENFNPVHEVVMFYLLYERRRRAEMENSEIIIENMKRISCPSGVVVHPSGIERSIHEGINAFASCYGDKQEKKFRVWVDRVSSSQIGSDAWLVKFDKWEQSDEGRQCGIMTILLISKPETPDGFSLAHVHQTWMDGWWNWPQRKLDRDCSLGSLTASFNR